jgi:hypothetical protein
MWPEHRKVCKSLPLGELPEEFKHSLWVKLPSTARQIIVQCMDVESLCRTDSIMHNANVRVAWQEALNGTYSPALSKWPRYSNKDKFQGLAWCMNRRVVLKGVRLDKIYDSRGDSSDPHKHFFWLCENGYSRIACFLIESGFFADVNEQGEGSYRALFTATEHGLVDVMKALIARGADINATEPGDFSPLFMASQNGHITAVEVLLQNHANVDTPNAHGGTCLHIASQLGHTSIVDALLRAGAAVDGDGEKPFPTALVLATRHNRLEVVRLLLAADANPWRVNVAEYPNLHQPNGTSRSILNALIEAKALNQGYEWVSQALDPLSTVLAE